MPNALIAAIAFLSAAGITAAALPQVRRLAERFGLYDVPGGRRIHRAPIPRIGGLAMYLGFVVAIGVSFILPVTRFPAEVERITLLVIGATIIVVTMVFDDIVGIHPLPKLLIQIGVAGLLILPSFGGDRAGIIIEQFNVPFFGTVQLPAVLAVAFTTFWIVGMMNAMNWSDGLDGLAGSIALVAAIILFLHTYFRPDGNPQFTISLLAIAFAGALVGFLPFNWHPSKILMGDTGSMFLGFALATISVIGGAKIATALLALGVPIVDMASVIIYRVMRGRSPMQADRVHLHHRLLDSGWTQPQIVSCYGALALLFGIIGLVLPSRELKLAALIIMGAVVLGLVVWHTHEQSGQDEVA